MRRLLVTCLFLSAATPCAATSLQRYQREAREEKEAWGFVHLGERFNKDFPHPRNKMQQEAADFIAERILATSPGLKNERYTMLETLIKALFLLVPQQARQPHIDALVTHYLEETKWFNPTGLFGLSERLWAVVIYTPGAARYLQDTYGKKLAERVTYVLEEAKRYVTEDDNEKGARTIYLNKRIPELEAISSALWDATLPLPTREFFSDPAAPAAHPYLGLPEEPLERALVEQLRKVGPTASDDGSVTTICIALATRPSLESPTIQALVDVALRGTEVQRRAIHNLLYRFTSTALKDMKPYEPASTERPLQGCALGLWGLPIGAEFNDGGSRKLPFARPEPPPRREPRRNARRRT